MRIVRKINLTLVAAMAVAAGVNGVVLQTTVMPLFYKIEEAASERNEGRALEALKTVEQRVAEAAAAYAAAMVADAGGGAEGLARLDESLTAGAMTTLELDYVAVFDAGGRRVLDRAVAADDGKAAGAAAFRTASGELSGRLQRDSSADGIGSDLVLSPRGPLAIGYARIGGASDDRGTIVFGRAVDMSALKAMTKVAFRLEPVEAGTVPKPAFLRLPESIETRRTLTATDGDPMAELVTVTTRRNVMAGQTAIWWASGLMFGSMLVLLVCVGVAIHLIAVRRIERIRSHLSSIAASGDLDPMVEDRAGDELSETIVSFNRMALQLAELRSEIRRSDYRHGAADQAAGLLHNLRNAVSPVTAMAWDLEQRETAGWRTNITRVLEELDREDVDAARLAKLQGLLVLSVREALKADLVRQGDLQLLNEMLRHMEEILREEDRLAQSDRRLEPVDLTDAVSRAVRRLGLRPGLVATVDAAPGSFALGYRVVIDQILDNLVVNASQAIEAAGRSGGRIALAMAPAELSGEPAIEIAVSDNGDGIPNEDLGSIFRKGFSTRRERSGGLGLHWCANAAKAMGGQLCAQSHGSGEGATLRLILPLAPLNDRVAA